MFHYLEKTLHFTKVMDLLGVDQTLATLVVGVIIGAIVIAALYWFFGTEIGCALRATGNNEFYGTCFRGKYRYIQSFRTGDF